VRAARTAAQGTAQPSGATSFGETDFLQIQPRRYAIHAREGGHCCYCLRRLITQRRCLDHVVPQAKLGGNSYRNLASCCLDCNSLKADRDAVEFVRSLYRDRRLSSDELTGRLPITGLVHSSSDYLSSHGDNSFKVKRQRSSLGVAAVPSDQWPTGIMNSVIGSGAP